MWTPFPKSPNIFAVDVSALRGDKKSALLGFEGRFVICRNFSHIKRILPFLCFKGVPHGNFHPRKQFQMVLQLKGGKTFERNLTGLFVEDY
jgi:hypothetical protein